MRLGREVAVAEPCDVQRHEREVLQVRVDRRQGRWCDHVISGPLR